MKTKQQLKSKIITLPKLIKTVVTHILKDLSLANIYLEKHLGREPLAKSSWRLICLPMKKLPSKYSKKIELKIKRISRG
jgi:hypothetical protein